MLELDSIDVSIGGLTVVRKLSLAIEAHQFWGVLGKNGAGKTTLLKALAGLISLDAGSIRLMGEALGSVDRKVTAQRLGMLTQNTDYAFEATLEQTALMGRHPHLGPWERESAQDYAKVHQALDRLSLLALKDRSCMDLSGGESRRLALASLLVQDPSVYILDEPTNHLDPANQVSVLNVMGQHIRTQEKAGIMALHEVNLATCYCTHCLMLFGDGQWMAGPTEELLTTTNLSRLYDCRIRLVDDGEQQVFAVGA
jgi:iron complex transport system ATP-binding protein